MRNGKGFGKDAHAHRSLDEIIENRFFEDYFVLFTMLNEGSFLNI